MNLLLIREVVLKETVVTGMNLIVLDMDVERLPSGKFVTNSLVLQLAQTAYNLLRKISIDVVEFENVKVSRRKIKTILFPVHTNQRSWGQDV
jgi:hypothetical protein